MTTHRTSTAIHSWMSLDAGERDVFARAIAALAAAGIDAPEPDLPRPRPAIEQIPLAGLEPAGPGTAPLPLGSGRRTTRLSVLDVDPQVFLPKDGRQAGFGETVHVYVAGCAGTAALYRASQTVIYKVGTTTGPIAARIAGLNAIGYAGWRRDGQVIVAEPGFDTWRAEELGLTQPRLSGSPVQPCHMGLAVTLPPGLSAEAFDVAVTSALAPISVAALLATPRFRLGLCSAGCDPAVLERYSPKSDGSGHKRVAELVRLQPRRDADSLAALIEGIVAAHLTRDTVAA